jgi:general secretion pathway protein N
MIRFKRHRPAFVASAAALFLAGGAIAQAHAQARSKDQSQVSTAPSAALVSPLAARSLDALAETRDRPLFSPSRRGPAPPPVVVMPPAPPAPPPSPPSVTLFGVVMDAGEARAIVRAGSAGPVRRVRIGDDIDGWKVTQIEQRQLTVSRDGRAASFTMFNSGGNPAAKMTGKQIEAAAPSTPPVHAHRDRRGE